MDLILNQKILLGKGLRWETFMGKASYFSACLLYREENIMVNAHPFRLSCLLWYTQNLLCLKVFVTKCDFQQKKKNGVETAWAYKIGSCRSGGQKMGDSGLKYDHFLSSVWINALLASRHACLHRGVWESEIDHSPEIGFLSKVFFFDGRNSWVVTFLWSQRRPLLTCLHGQQCRTW